MEDKNRPDPEGNEAASTGGAAGGSAAAVMAAERGGETNLAPHTRATTDDKAGDAGSQEGNAPYVTAGREFTHWFNSMLTKVPNPVLKLGTKTARVETLHDDGRLEVYVEGEAGEAEQQFVLFESAYLDALLLKFASASR